MASDSKILKGILKDRSEDSKPNANARELAVQHATILQHRKDLESQILASIILLSEYPQAPSPPYTASSPAPSDLTAFKQHVRRFQPSDYDDLIEERNVNELCGYTLCPNPHLKTNSKGVWKITSSGVVKRKDFEKWCSKECARRAMYVKVQLSETAAWERVGIPDIEIEIMDEGEKETEEEKVERGLRQLRLEEEKGKAEDQAALAVERGEPGTANHPALNKVVVKEKEAKATKDGVGAFEDLGEDEGMKLEGYMSKLDLKSKSKKK